MAPRTATRALAPVRGDCYNASCPAHAVLVHVTGRWGVLLLGALLEGTQRYSHLRTRVAGISEKMLAQKLREFERDGLIVRRQYPVVPPRVEYALTPAGERVARGLFDIVDWLETHVSDLQRAQNVYDRREARTRA